MKKIRVPSFLGLQSLKKLGGLAHQLAPILSDTWRDVNSFSKEEQGTAELGAHPVLKTKTNETCF